jgi:hypothetical protein
MDERHGEGRGKAEGETVHAGGTGRRRTIVVGLGAGALVLGCTGLALALSQAGASTPAGSVSATGCGASGPHLTVQGTGQASAPPDVLTAVFGFSTTAGNSASALSQNNTQVSQALLALAANGVATRDVQTTGLTLQPQYAYPRGVPTLLGYQVTNTVTATLRDTKTAGAAVDGVVNASGNAAQIDSLTFSFGNPATVEDVARADAVEQAKSHAKAMATAAGRSLGALCSLTDNTQPSLFESNGFAAPSGVNNATAGVPVEPGTQKQTDQVTLVYALRQR